MRRVSALHAVAALGLAIALSLAAGLALEKAPFWLVAAGGELALLAAAVLPAAATQANLREAFFLRLPGLRMLVLALAGAVALHLVLRASYPLLVESLKYFKLLYEDKISELERDVNKALADAPLATLLVLVLLTPICEETLFRGLLLSGFGRTFGWRAALFATGVLFALVHFLPIRMIITLALGLFFGFVVLRSGSLSVAIAAHGANNLLSLFLPSESTHLDVVIGIAALPVFAVIVWLIRRRRPENDDVR